MNNYQFSDVSHHKGALPFQSFADLGHRLEIAKASDSYHLPDKNNQYDFPANRHYDAYWVDNYLGFRTVGLLCAGYHFARFDEPWGSSRDVIIQKNLEYYLTALDMIPNEYQSELNVGILDMEQAATQLNAAGLSKVIVSDMAVKMATIFSTYFSGKLIFYSGSWWTDSWLTVEASTEIATMATCWEPEYPAGMLGSDGHSITASFKDFIPSVPKGFTPEFTTIADDMTGKLFAHQYTDGGRVPGVNSNIDLNRTEMSKEELYKFFGQSGAVDPPGGGTDLTGLEADHDEIIARLDKIEVILADIQANCSGTSPEPPSDFIVLSTMTDKNRIPLSYGTGWNNASPPKMIMEFYPGDSSAVGDRIKVHPGSSVRVFPRKIKSDGGKLYWKIADYSQLNYMEGSEANVPADFSPDNDLKALYIQDKFIA